MLAILQFELRELLSSLSYRDCTAMGNFIRKESMFDADAIEFKGFK